MILFNCDVSFKNFTCYHDEDIQALLAGIGDVYDSIAVWAGFRTGLRTAITDIVVTHTGSEVLGQARLERMDDGYVLRVMMVRPSVMTPNGLEQIARVGNENACIPNSVTQMIAVDMAIALGNSLLGEDKYQYYFAMKQWGEVHPQDSSLAHCSGKTSFFPAWVAEKVARDLARTREIRIGARSKPGARKEEKTYMLNRRLHMAQTHLKHMNHEIAQMENQIAALRVKAEGKAKRIQSIKTQLNAEVK